METFAQWIEDQLTARHWRPADLARAAGVRNATLSRVLNGDRNPGPDLCRAIAGALGEPEEKIFRLAGLLSPLRYADDSTLQEIIELARNLSPENRQIVLDIVKTIFRRQQEEKK